MSQQGQQVYNGRYELHRKIARGGMADVYLARDSLLDRPVALKVLFPEFATDPSFVERFRREAQSAANLSHPNIVSVYDWGEEAGTYYIVMEYIEGRSLSQIIRDEGPMHPDRAADVTADIAAALSFAHRNGVVHRDVKPGNVLISPTGQVKVTDFGIARAVTTQENLTQTGTVMGTATYFSPEQAQGHQVDPRSDVYSLGVVLYEMLTGAPPFSGDSPVAVAFKHVQETPRPPRQVNAALPAALEAITLKAMAKNAANRYASAEDLRADLHRFRASQPVLAEPILPPPVVEEPTRAQRATAATAAVGGGGGTTVLREVERQYDDYDEPPRRSAAFIVVLVLLLALLAGLLFLFARNLGIGDGGGAQVDVPRVTDRSQAEAEFIIAESGLQAVAVPEENVDVPEGTVFRQEPDPGVRVDEGEEVRIFVSSGQPPVSVPNVANQTEADARTAIEGRALRVSVQREPSDDVDEGLVIRQSPEPDEEVAVDSTVTIVVSTGPAPVAVPAVAGLSAESAAGKLGQAGFEPRRGPDEFSDSVPSGRVVRTDPPAGTEAQKESVVTYFVSRGPATTTTESTTTTTTTSTTTTTTTLPETTTTTDTSIAEDAAAAAGDADDPPMADESAGGEPPRRRKDGARR